MLQSKDLETKTTTSNDEGVFRFEQLSPSDSYKMEVSSPYFETAKIRNLKINSGKKVILNLELKVGSESVTVGNLAEDGPIIDMNSSTITTTITGASWKVFRIRGKTLVGIDRRFRRMSN